MPITIPVMNHSSPQRTISPRHLAEAIGMSESSLKRWADRGFLSVTRTAGGHRRIDVQEAIRFIRSRELTVLDPILLGLPGSSESYSMMGSNTSEVFLSALLKGDLELAQSCIVARYMSGSSISEIGDGPLKSALQYLGAKGHGSDQIMLEHRATELCIQVVHQLRALARPTSFSFKAVGGSVAGDPYILPSLLVSSVISEHGGDATNLGPNTPFEAMRHQTTLLSRESRPDLAWISVGQIDNGHALSNEIATFVSECLDAGIQVVVGGRLVGDLALEPLDGLSVHATLTSLANAVQALGARSEVA